MMANPTETAFDPKAFLITAGPGRSSTFYETGAVIYRQADTCSAVFYVKSGKVKMVVSSKQGKEAVIAILEPGAFFGEGCLIGQENRMASAVAMVASDVVRVEKPEMIRLLRDEPSFAAFFISHLLSRNNRVEEDLVDQLFNSSEKRLARTLLLLANFDKEREVQAITAHVSQETLAEIVGTTRPRISHFMNKFRKLGHISYNGHLQVHSSLLTVVLRD